MYSGHVLGIAAVFQALTGDDRFARDGFSTTIPPGLPRAGTQHTTTTLQLAERIAGAMVRNKSGGMTCEPGLVFIQCNNHPHIAFRMLEQMYPINSKGKGESEGGAGVDFSAVRERWERFILHNMRSPTANAGLKIFVHSPTGASCCGHSIPFGHLGSDGWSLAYYHPWAAHPALARTMWTGGTKKVRVGSCIASLVWAREGARPVAHERERTRTRAHAVAGRETLDLHHSLPSQQPHTNGH